MKKIRNSMVKYTPCEDNLIPNAPIIGQSKTTKRYIAWIPLFSIASKKVFFFIHY